MDTIQSLIKKHNITITCDMVDKNPQIEDDEWAKKSNHYKVTLKRGVKKMTLFYSMGKGICREPTVEDVINSLQLDYSSIQSEGSFENWASSLGYDSDSRKALKSYEMTKKLTWKYAKFMGQDLLKALSECECL